MTAVPLPELADRVDAACRRGYRGADRGKSWWMTPGPGSTGGSKLPQLLVSVLLLGIADSMIGPYLVLFGADEARLSALQVGVFMSVIAVSGLAVSTWLGRRYDRSASRAPAFIALAAPAVGYLALTTTTRYAMLLLIAAAFPQLFSLARTHLDRSGGGATRRGTPAALGSPARPARPHRSGDRWPRPATTPTAARVFPAGWQRRPTGRDGYGPS